MLVVAADQPDPKPAAMMRDAIGAEFKRPLQDRRGKGVIDHHQRAGIMRDIGGMQGARQGRGRRRTHRAAA